MELWTEYEGRTIDGAFPLKKLLLPEGRSAFFSTSNGKGVPTVIRLIASHFDEEEILARWRGVESLGHPNILKTEQYGQLVLDDTTVVYAVFEPVDANLAEVISGQQLTLDEARQLASSLASALALLHVHGFVHEHVEPANVFAVGEVVKLRGDCIRETPEGEAGLEAKRRDVHDLASVLLLSLSQTDTSEAAGKVRPLPAPFGDIVRNGLSGVWSLGQMMAALEQGKAAASTAPAAATPTAATNPKTELKLASKPDPRMDSKDAAKTSMQPVPAKDTSDAMPVKGTFVPPAARSSFAAEEDRPLRSSSVKWLAAGAVVLLLIVWLIWHRTHVSHANQRVGAESNPAAASATALPGSGQGTASPGAPPPTSKPTAAASPVAPKKPLAAAGKSGASLHEQWRVVAFTYNHADQAQKKVESIQQKHRDLRPEVFAPNGHAPYLVTVGGVMGRDQALAFAQRVKKLGLPSDSYAQNYSGNRR